MLAGLKQNITMQWLHDYSALKIQQNFHFILLEIHWIYNGYIMDILKIV